MTSCSDVSSSRFAIWLPDCPPTEAEAFERFCREAAARLDGQVVTVFRHDTARLRAALHAGEFDTLVYPKHSRMLRDALLAGMVHGVFLGSFKVTLRCADEPTFLAVPRAFAPLTQAVIANHLDAFCAQSWSPVGKALPFGYRREGQTVVIVPEQAERVRAAFRDAAAGR